MAATLIFMMHSTNDFLALPESASSETLKDSIYQEMNAFKDPKSGDSAFVSFEQQTAMLQNMLAKS